MIRMRLLLVSFICVIPTRIYADVSYVIHISVDGLGSSYLQGQIEANALPSFQRLQSQGAWTNNARADNDLTVTLPNHTSQMTGRYVMGPGGHQWTENGEPPPGETLHSNNHGNYIASIFDVAHDNGMRTGLYVGKSKFSLFDTSYNTAHGAPDVTGANNGTDKIDVYNFAGTAADVASAFITDATALPNRYSFLHLADTDVAGHGFGWGSSQYNAALGTVDTALTQIFSFIDSNANYHNHTYVVLTTDHGGGGGAANNHIDATNPLNFTIPFYVWGPTVAAGADLYALNGSSRVNPGTGKIAETDFLQPVRNGDSANLELALLGLGPVPGSTINFSQNLRVAAVPEPASLVLMGLVIPGLLLRRRSRN